MIFRGFGIKGNRHKYHSEIPLFIMLRLKDIMVGIHNQCKKYGAEEDGYVNYVKGANIAGFVKVADAMLAQGVV